MIYESGLVQHLIHDFKNSSHGHDSQIKKELDQDLQEKNKKIFIELLCIPSSLHITLHVGKFKDISFFQVHVEPLEQKIPKLVPSRKTEKTKQNKTNPQIETSRILLSLIIIFFLSWI